MVPLLFGLPNPANQDPPLRIIVGTWGKEGERERERERVDEWKRVEVRGCVRVMEGENRNDEKEGVQLWTMEGKERNRSNVVAS